MSEADQKLLLGALILANIVLIAICYFIPLDNRSASSGEPILSNIEENSKSNLPTGAVASSKNLDLASLWIRIGGALVDLLIVAIVSSVIIFIWGLFIGFSQATSSAINWEVRGFFVGLIVDFLITVVPMSGNKQSTLGQRAVGIKTIMSNGDQVSFATAFIRYFVSLFSSIMLKLGFAIALFTKNKRTLHDLAAGTIVVKE